MHSRVHNSAHCSGFESLLHIWEWQSQIRCASWHITCKVVLLSYHGLSNIRVDTDNENVNPVLWWAQPWVSNNRIIFENHEVLNDDTRLGEGREQQGHSRGRRVTGRASHFRISSWKRTNAHTHRPRHWAGRLTPQRVSCTLEPRDTLESVYGSIVLQSPNWEPRPCPLTVKCVRKQGICIWGLPGMVKMKAKPEWILEHNVEWGRMLGNMCGMLLFLKS